MRMKKVNLQLERPVLKRGRAEAARRGTDLSGLVRRIVLEIRARDILAGRHASLRDRLRLKRERLL